MGNALASSLVFGKSTLRHLQDLARDSLSPPLVTFAEVTSGAQTGSVAIIESDEFTVGNEVDDDLLILDLPDPEKVRLTTSRSFAGRVVTISSDRDDVLINQRRSLSGEVTERLPVEVSCGGTSIVISGNVETLEHSGRSKRSNFLVLAASLLLGGGALLLFSVAHREDARIVRADSGATVGKDRRSGAEDAVRTLIADAGLTNSVKFMPSGEGTFLLTGLLNNGQHTQWRAIETEVDQYLAGYAVINTVEARPQLANIPDIAVVVTSPMQFLYLTTGVRIQIGEILVDDWVLTDVDDEKFAVTRDTETIWISL